MIIRKAILAVLISAVFNSANAEIIPHRGELDYRLRHVDYTERQVYHIDAQVGVATHLKFSDDEVFEKWYSGDSEAFLLTNHKNYVSIKPVTKHAKTNMLILTNKRAYNLYVHIHQHTSKRGTYGVHFQYPEEEAKEAEKLALLEESKRLLDPSKQIKRNKKYVGAGSKFIRPTEVFDNGTHTYFYFPEKTDMPSIFRVRRDNKELLTNPTTIGNWRVVPRVQREWTLRLGDDVICIRNLGYTNVSEDNKTNTVSETIERKDKVN